MHKQFFTIILLTLLSFSINGQGTPQPVKWDFSIEKADATSYKVTAKATIDKKWCVYSSKLDGKGPIPTSINYEPNVIIKGDINETSKKIERYDRLFEMKLVKYENEAVFTQLVGVNDGAKSIDGSLKFMTCDGGRCLPPTNVDFSLPIPQ